VQRMVVSCRVGWVWMVKLPEGRMSMSGWIGSWLNVMRGCVHGGSPTSGRMGVVEGTKPELNAVNAAGPEGV
jgi:hypothetical protein